MKVKVDLDFGECLRFLLNNLDISMSRLSKYINVDSSLISRWALGKRIPQYGTNYIESIAEYLSKNINNSYQQEIINKYYIDVCGENNYIENNKEKLLFLLRETQGYSIECKRIEQKKRLNELTIYNHHKNYNTDYEAQNNEKFLLSSIGLSDQDRIIFGFHNILLSINSLLELIIKNKRINKSNSIYLTYNTISSNDCPKDWLEIFKKNILKAIDRGWNIVFLIKINGNINNIIGFIEFLIPMIKEGNIDIYYYKQYDLISFDRELFIIEDIGVLSGFPSDVNATINNGFYIKNKAAIDIYINYIKSLINTNTKRLINYYTKDNYNKFISTLVETAEQNGDYYNYNNNYNLLLIPEMLYKKLLIKADLTPNEISLSMQYYNKYMNSVINKLHDFQYFDIYFAIAMEILYKYRKINLYTCAGIKLVKLEIQDVIDLIENTIHFINTYNNYNIAVIFQKTNVKNDVNYCIKEKQSVFINIKRTTEIRLSIEEPMLVHAAEENFFRHWNQIAPINKDKAEICKWLQKYIDRLQDQ